MRLGTRLGVVAVAGVVCAASVIAAQVDRFRSRSFTVESDLPRLQAQRLVEHMDVVYAELERRFAGFADRSGVKPELLLYADQDGYLEGLRERYGFDARGSAGVFVVARNGASVAAWLGDRDEHAVERTLQHEAFHLINALRLGGRVPLWVNEGLAEYFERGLVVRGRFRLGIVDRADVVRKRAAVEADAFLHVRDIVLVDSDAWIASVRRGDAAALYLQSWSMVHFLIEAENGRYERRFVRYLELCADGMDHARAWERVFGEGEAALARFEEAWAAWLAGVEPDPLSVARERLELWAVALEELHGRGDTVEDLDGLRTRLGELGWSAVLTIDGEQRVLTAESDGWFELPPGARDVRFLETEDGALPQGVSITGIRGVRPSLTWERVTERTRSVGEAVGSFRSVIEF